MTVSIDQAFVRQFEAEIHVAYQRMGSKLRPTIRSKNNIRGSTAVFQKVGRGMASIKSRNGNVPVMNIDHTPVMVDLEDYYAGDWIDFLDELKVNHDEKLVAVNAGAYALGRKTDQLIINALDNNTSIVKTSGTGSLTKQKILNAFEVLGSVDVPDDGQRFAIVGWKQWSDLLSLPEFSNAEYVGDDNLPWRGSQAKNWLGTLWIPHSGLPLVNKTRKCFWYHKTAIVHASGQDIKTDVTWHGDKAAYFVNSMMSQGASVIDASGIVCLPCAES